MALLINKHRLAGITLQDGEIRKTGKKARVKRNAAAMPAFETNAAVAPEPKHKTITDEWRAMGPFSKIMATLGLFGFIVGIPGWVSSEYWMGKDPTSILVPPAIAEQLNPQQIEQLTAALDSLQQGGGLFKTNHDQISQALDAANRGNLKLAEGLLEDVYQKSAGAVSGAQAEQALAARHLAALSVVGDAGKALTLYQQATTLDPSNKEGWLGLGDAAVVAGTLPVAEDAYRRYLALAPVETNPLPHSGGLDRLGDILLSKGDIAGAQQSYEAAMEITRHLATNNPAQPDLQRNYAVSLRKMGDLQATAGAYDKALTSYQQAVKSIQTLSGAPLTAGDIGWDLTAMFNNIGDMEVRLNHPVEALNAYSDGLRIAETLVEATPNDVRLMRDLAVSHVKVADIKAATGQENEALIALSKALSIREILTRTDPANSEWQRDMAINLIKIGSIKLAQSDPTIALNNFAQSLSILEKMIAQDPANPGLQRDVSVALGRIGDAQKNNGQLSEASVAHGKSLEIVSILAQRQPENAEFQRDIVIGHVKLAEDGAEPAVNFGKALLQAEMMQEKGMLGPIDQWMIGDLKKRLAELPDA